MLIVGLSQVSLCGIEMNSYLILVLFVTFRNILNNIVIKNLLAWAKRFRFIQNDCSESRFDAGKKAEAEKTAEGKGMASPARYSSS